MAFCKPSKADRRLLLAAIRAFSTEWKLSGDHDESISNLWMEYCARRADLSIRRLDWVGFCILGGFDRPNAPRSEVRRAILDHASRSLK